MTSRLRALLRLLDRVLPAHHRGRRARRQFAHDQRRAWQHGVSLSRFGNPMGRVEVEIAATIEDCIESHTTTQDTAEAMSPLLIASYEDRLRSLDPVFYRRMDGTDETPPVDEAALEELADDILEHGATLMVFEPRIENVEGSGESWQTPGSCSQWQTDDDTPHDD